MGKSDILFPQRDCPESSNELTEVHDTGTRQNFLLEKNKPELFDIGALTTMFLVWNISNNPEFIALIHLTQNRQGPDRFIQRIHLDIYMKSVSLIYAKVKACFCETNPRQFSRSHIISVGSVVSDVDPG